MGGLAGKIVVVTGAAQGLGTAYARRLGGEGCHLVLADLQADKLAAVADELTASGVSATAVAADVTSESSVREMLATATERFGRLDGLVNNAAIYFGLKPVDSELLDRNRWERTMRVNVWGTFLCSALAAGVMADQGRGRIVNVASSVAYSGPPKMADYVASKGAVISLSRGLAREYGERGVTVNVVAPGGTWTEASQELFGGVGADADPEVIRAAQIARQSIPRQQRPEDVTGAVCFLLSDDSSMITGQVLLVDGGEIFI